MSGISDEVARHSVVDIARNSPCAIIVSLDWEGSTSPASDARDVLRVVRIGHPDESTAAVLLRVIALLIAELMETGDEL